MPDLEIDFPRGGELAPNSDEPKSKGKKRKADTDEEASEKKRQRDPLYENVFMRRLVKELLTEDVRALGIVKEIKDTELILDTANGITCMVPVKNISQEFVKVFGDVELTDVFKLGQALAFKVVNPSKGKGKQDVPIVSIDPNVVNSHLVPAALKNALVLNGTVRSLEDKGAVVDIGMGKVTGFVQDSDVPADFKPLQPGQVLMFRVRKMSAKPERVIQLSAFAEADCYEQLSDRNQILPGTIISAEPEKVVGTGVFVKLSETERAFVHVTSLPPRLRLDPNRFGKTIRVCVTSILPNSGLFTVTAHPDIVALSNLSKRTLKDHIGDMISATVYDIDVLGNVHYYLGDNKERPDFLTAKSLQTHFDSYETDIGKFKPTTVHQLRIVGYQWLERALILSNRKDTKKQAVIEAKQAHPGRRMVGFVKKVKPSGLVVRFGAKGQDEVLGTVLSKHVADIHTKNWMDQFQVDQRITCRVLFFDDARSRLILTAKPSLVNSNHPVVADFDPKLEGAAVVGQLIQKFVSGAFLVSFYNRVCGFLPAPEAKTQPDLELGRTVKCRVARVDPAQRRILLSLGAGPELASLVKAEKVTRPAKPFGVYQATVVGPWEFGKTSPYTTAELRLPGGSIGRLHASELDLPDADDGHAPMARFIQENRGKQVRVKVICVGIRTWINDNAKEKLMKKCGTVRFVECTTKQHKIDEPHKKLRLIAYESHFGKADPVRAFVADGSKCERDGYIVAEINPCFQAHIPTPYIDKIVGQKAAKPNHKMDSLSKKTAAFSLDDGQIINGLVISLGKTQRSRFVQMTWGQEFLRAEAQAANETQRKRTESQKSNKSDDVNESADANEMEVEYEELDPEVAWSAGDFSMENLAKVGRQRPQSTVDEDAEVDVENNDSDDEEIVEDAVEPKDVKEEEERTVRLKESVAESAAEFDRLLTASPNSSDLWIKYMTHFACKNQLDEARRIVQRALDVIHHREQQELFNVWTAYLNLEILYGSEESLKQVFDKAVASMDALRMHKQLADIYRHHEKFGELGELYEVMLKKFRHDDLELWFDYAQFLYQRQESEKARGVMKRALDSLPKRNHVTVMSRFAQLEYKFGDAERGKTIFEKVLTTYPKKTDVWSVYVDMSIKHEGVHEARRILERIVKQSLPTTKKRVLLKKWIELEQKHGTEQTLQHCREVIGEALGQDSEAESD